VGTSTFVEDFKEELEFRPVKGEPNIFLIHPRKNQPSKEQMSDDDWNEFERHISEAFEQVP
jgi:hypothetical protein